MTRSVLLLLVVTLASLGCAPRFDVFADWTVQGFAPASVCGQLEAPSIRLRAVNRDVVDGPATEDVTTAECTAENTKLSVASFADLFVDLIDGDSVFGTAGPFELAPASANDGYLGSSEEAPLHVDIGLERGRLRAHFTVVGKSCADAGAGSFSVAVSRNASPLEEDVIVQGETVECQDGDAVFSIAPVELGVRYSVAATTTIGGEAWATELPGEGVVPGGALTTMVVDLDTPDRP